MNTPASASAADGRSARWDRHRADRRRELIRAARQAVHALGPGASMEEIAAAAGTSKPVFYRYFGDKAGLQRAVGEVVIGKMQARLQEAAAAARTPREALRAMVSAYLQMAESSPNVYAFVTRTQPADGAGEPAGADALSHLTAAVAALMDAALQAQLPSGGDRAPGLRYWPAAAIGMVRAGGEAWLGSPEGPDKPGREEMTEELTGWLLAGLAAQFPESVRLAGSRTAKEFR